MIHPSIHPSVRPRKGAVHEAGKSGREKSGGCARVALIRPSASLSPSSCTVPVEYRLSVVRLGVLRPSKYLGIFEELRVPKKTVYFVGKEGSIPGERQNAPRLEQFPTRILFPLFLAALRSNATQSYTSSVERCKKKKKKNKGIRRRRKEEKKWRKHESELHFGITVSLCLSAKCVKRHFIWSRSACPLSLSLSSVEFPALFCKILVEKRPWWMGTDANRI